MFKAKRNERGFTLIELMVVMAVLATLSGIVIGGVTGIGTKSKESTFKSDQQIIQSAVDRFYAESVPQRYPIADANDQPVRTSAIDVPTTTVTRTIDFYFPLLDDGQPSSSVVFVPSYLKTVPASVSLVTWQISFPSATVSKSGTLDSPDAHPDSLKTEP